MNQRHSKRGRLPQGRGNAWMDEPRSQQPFVASSPTPEGVYSNPLLAHALTTLVGCVVEVKVQSGVVYEGVLRAISPNMDIALSVAHEMSKPPSRENVKKLLELRFQDIVTVSAKTNSNPSFNNKDIFKTDTEISRSNGPSTSREFERFTDFADSDLTLEDGSAGWTVEEMFSVNRDKFQVTSNYDENLSQYTTKLDRDTTEEYKVRAARAAFLAGQIEDKGKSKIGFDDTGTEEELFSAVVREHKEAPPPPSTHPTPSLVPTPPTSTQPTANLSDNNPRTDGKVENDEKTLKSDTPTTLPQSPLVSSSVADVPSPSVAMVPSQPEHESSAVPQVVHEGQSSITVVESSSDIVKDENETKQVGVVNSLSAESAPTPIKELAVKDEKSAVVEKTPDESDDSPQPQPQSESTVTSTDTSVKDKDSEDNTSQKITFKLNPNAKEFVFTPSPAPPVTTVATTARASPSPTVSSTPSSVRTSPSSTYHTSSGRRPYKTRQQRTVTPTQSFFPSEYIVQTTPVSGGAGYVIPQTGGGLIRPSVHPGSQVVYPFPYQLQAGQPGVMNAYNPQQLQQVVSSGTAAAVTPNHQQQQQIMLAQLQQQQLLQQVQQQQPQQQLMAAHQQQAFFNQQAASQLQQAGLTGSQAQIQAFTPQVIYSPQGTGQVMFNMTPQGGMATPGGATPLVASGPLHSSIQPQTLLSGGGVNPAQQIPQQQPQVFAQNRVGYPPHPPGVGNK